MRLEDFIKENRSAFENEEPTEGHFERFEARLKNNKQRKNVALWRYVGAVAAVALLLISIGFFMNRETSQIQECELSGDALKQQQHYTATIHKEMEHIKTLLSGVDANTRNEVWGEVVNIEEDSKNFINDICCFDNNKSIKILEEHYLPKIEALQRISSVFGNSDRTINTNKPTTNHVSHLTI